MAGYTAKGRSILFICDFNTHGGTQTHLLHLLGHIDRGRFRPRLAAVNLHPALARRLAGLEVEVTDLGLKGALRPGTVRAVFDLAARARSGDADLLHGYLFAGNLLAAAVSGLAGVPCITSVRNLDLGRRGLRLLASRRAHRRARCVLFNSARVRDATIEREGIPRERALVIPNAVADLRAVGDGGEREAGADVMPADLLDPSRPTVVSVASLREKKGHAMLLEAFALVARERPATRLLLVGEGPLRHRLAARAHEAGLNGSVVFAGHREQVASILKRSDLFVLSSREEGMPNALLEAMSAGLPSVVTDVGGNAEVVDEGRTGFLVPPDRPDLMAGRIAALLSDEGLRRRQGEAARRKYESSFTLGRMIDAYHAMYEEVLA
jgi:glycosyltransferase involved in cell wall biosynthesis